MFNRYIVIDDPELQYYDGALVERARAEQLRTRGCSVLPVDPDLFRQSGVGGYFRRAWGSGWPLDGTHPTMHAPMTLFCAERHVLLHWCARLVRDTVDLTTGQLRIAGDPSQHMAGRLAGITPVDKPIDIKLLGDAKRGGWVVGGTAKLTVGAEGHYGVALYGYAPGLAVLWAACTATAAES